MGIKIVTSANQSYEPIPEGVWDADVTRLFEWKEFNRFDNAEKEGIKAEFTLVNGDVGRKAYKFFGPFLTPKSHLWALWRAVKGGEPTAEELGAITEVSDLIKQLGAKPVQIIVKNRKSSKGNVYYNVTDYIRSARTAAVYPFEAGAPEGMVVSRAASSIPTTDRGSDTVVVDVSEKPVEQTQTPKVSKTDMKSIANELDSEEAAGVPRAAGKKVL